MTHFLAAIEFQSKGQENTAQVTEIRFTADSAEQAALDVMRFWECRHENIPKHFHKVLCIKLYNEHLGPIDARGMLIGCGAWPCYEWKCDTAGMPYADHVSARFRKAKGYRQGGE